MEKTEQQAVVEVVGGRQMGIGEKDRTHSGRIVLTLPTEVNKE
jgi:hypothetical protein